VDDLTVDAGEGSADSEAERLHELIGHLPERVQVLAAEAAKESFPGVLRCWAEACKRGDNPAALFVKMLGDGDHLARGSGFRDALNERNRAAWDTLTELDRIRAVEAYADVTGLKCARGSHGLGWLADPLGTDEPPRGSEANALPPSFEGKPTKDDFLDAWLARHAPAVVAEC
jgi:hypothetical protein